MRTNIVVDDDLMAEALKLSNLKTKKKCRRNSSKTTCSS